MSLISLTSREAAYKSKVRVLIVIVSKEGKFKRPKGCSNSETGCKLLGSGIRLDVEPGVKLDVGP